MPVPPQSFLTPEQVEGAVREWLALSLGSGNTHVSALLRNVLRGAALARRGPGDSVAVVCLGPEDLLGMFPGMGPARLAGLLGRDWSREAAPAREEFMRAVRAYVEGGGDG